jgi:hypothetical protein
VLYHKKRIVMFQKLVAIEPVSLIPAAEAQLRSFAREMILHSDIPANDGEVAARIGSADAVLLSYTSRITKAAGLSHVGISPLQLINNERSALRKGGKGGEQE